MFRSTAAACCLALVIVGSTGASTPCRADVAVPRRQLRAWLAKGAVAALSDPSEHVRVMALVRLGELAEPTTAETLAEFMSRGHTKSEREAALQAYAKLHVRIRKHLPEIAIYLSPPIDAQFAGPAAEAISAMGAAERFRPQLLQLLTCCQGHTMSVMSVREFRGITRLGEPLYLGTIRLDADVARGLAAGGALPEYRQQVLPLLRDPVTQADALWAVQTAGLTKEYLPEISSILKAGKPVAKVAYSAALNAVSSAGLGREYLPQIEWGLRQRKDENILAAAVRTIELTGLDRQYHTRINLMLKEHEASVRLAAVSGIASGGGSLNYISEIRDVLTDLADEASNAFREVAATGLEVFHPLIAKQLAFPARDVLEGLENAGAVGQYRKEIEDLLRKEPTSPTVLRAYWSDRCDIEDQIRLATVLYATEIRIEFPPPDVTYRFTVYTCSGGGRAAKSVLALVPRTQRRTSAVVPDEGDKRIAFESLASVAGLPDLDFRLRTDIAAALADLAKLIKWDYADLARLRKTRDTLARDFDAQAGVLTASIDAIERTQVAGRSLTTRTALTLLVQIAFWFALIVVYPRSRMVQAIFFWNPWVRRILGFGYVGFVLTWVPFLRRRLLAPFRDSLLADARLPRFSEAAYYADSKVRDQTAGETAAVTDALRPPLRGQVVLEGDSGLGKTMFLRHLAATSPSTAAFLPAASCAAGVLAAIQDKLKGTASDARFLRNLIWGGAVEIYIDGLNEVTADTRATIHSFMTDFFQANLLVTTQPLEWSPPGTARHYALLPLETSKIWDFLESREPHLPDDAPVRGDDYRDACARFLQQALDPAQPPDLLAGTLRALSSPMDLTVVAEMIARRQQPDLFRLQEQRYELMAADYSAINNAPFPLHDLAEEAYRMRLEDRPELAAGSFVKPLHAMERYKMVLRREEQSGPVWRFRHEKVMDFFLIHAFLGRDNPRPQQHLADPRFRGVYFMLATRLSYEDALSLRELLLQHAADTKDHTVSDTFIQILRSRNANAA
jgi:hypothetical protein